ncbi:MAG TPA: hypothetical protein VHZ24_22685, partial [Pirellulales bacterium]|nr:hypothetical protein [Pirellulales bacterium]
GIAIDNGTAIEPLTSAAGAGTGATAAGRAACPDTDGRAVRGTGGGIDDGRDSGFSEICDNRATVSEGRVQPSTRFVRHCAEHVLRCAVARRS